jgi:hypothetical protein
VAAAIGDDDEAIVAMLQLLLAVIEPRGWLVPSGTQPEVDTAAVAPLRGFGLSLPTPSCRPHSVVIKRVHFVLTPVARRADDPRHGRPTTSRPTAEFAAAWAAADILAFSRRHHGR